MTAPGATRRGTAKLAAVAGLALAWPACDSGAADEPGPIDASTGGTAGFAEASIEAGDASGSGGASGTEAGIGGGSPAPGNPPECPTWTRPTEGDACGYYKTPPEVVCRYSNRCSVDGCAARCIAGHWLVSCEPCDAKVPDCPAEAPAHDSSCNTAMKSFWCWYDQCVDNAFAWARCNGTRWEVNHGLCAGPAEPGCMGPGEDALFCGANTLCFDSSEQPFCTPHPKWDCPANPCVHEPLSCACAGHLCGPFLSCTEAKAGRVRCDPLPPGPNPPVALTAGMSGHSLAVSPEHVYWVRDGVQRVALAGGAPEKVISGSGYGTIAVDANYLFAADAAAGTLHRISLKTKKDVILATNLPWLHGLAINSTVVLWYATTEIVVVPIAGGSATTLYKGGVKAALADETHAYFEAGGALSSVPLVGGAPKLIDSGLGDHLTLDLTHVFVTDEGNPFSSGDGAVYKVPKSGGPPTYLASNVYVPTAAVVDDTHVYFSQGNGFVKRVPKSGGAVETFAAGYGKPNTLAIDQTHVYWATLLPDPCGRIWKRAK